MAIDWRIVSYNVRTLDDKKGFVVSRLCETVICDVDGPLSEVVGRTKNGAITGPENVFG